MLQVKATSPIDPVKQPYLFSWDNSARQYHAFFESSKHTARQNLKLLGLNPWTAWRDVIQLRGRYERVDELALRQKLGEISDGEVAEVNRVMGGSSTLFTRARSEPAKMYAWKTLPVALSAGLGLSLGAYGTIVKGYNNLWLVAGLLPVIAYMGVAAQKQPAVKIENAYRYILAKRVATCELEANIQRMAANEFTKAAEYEDLTTMMSQQGQTLYDVEADLVNRIMSGKG